MKEIVITSNLIRLEAGEKELLQSIRSIDFFIAPPTLTPVYDKGTFYIEYLETDIKIYKDRKNIKTINKSISRNELEKIYESSKLQIRDVEQQVESNPSFTKIIKNAEDKISIDPISSLFFNNDDLDDEEKDISLEIHSNYPPLHDFWWEDISRDCSVKVLRVFNSEKTKIEINSTDALFFISRAREGDDLIDTIKKEINEFNQNFISSFVDCKRNHFIDKVHIEYLRHNNSCSYNELKLLHIVGHGDSSGRFLAENEYTEDNPEKYDFINQDQFVDLLKDKKIDIVNLSFCNSSINNDKTTLSLPIKLLDNGVANYVIAVKTGFGTNHFNRFNEVFYSKMFKGSKNIEDSFFIARDKLDDYHRKNSLSLFKISYSI